MNDRERAREIVGKYLENGLIEYTDDDGTAMINDIADALSTVRAEERERCAKIAEDKACRYMNPERCEMEKNDLVVWPDDCPGCRTAQAIRTQGENT